MCFMGPRGGTDWLIRCVVLLLLGRCCWTVWPIGEAARASAWMLEALGCSGWAGAHALVGKVRLSGCARLGEYEGGVGERQGAEATDRRVQVASSRILEQQVYIRTPE